MGGRGLLGRAGGSCSMTIWSLFSITGFLGDVTAVLCCGIALCGIFACFIRSKKS
jgi:hypothetical protein